MRRVAWVVNAFGFGPTSVALTWAEAARLADPSVDHVFVVDSLTAQAVGDLFDTATVSSLRSADALARWLRVGSTRDTTVVSAQNRFALCAAREQGVPAVMLDALAWFWPACPAAYAVADYYIGLSVPWRSRPSFSLPPSGMTARAAVGAPPRAAGRREDRVVISINGFSTPYSGPQHDAFLALVARALEPAVAEASRAGRQITLIGSRSAVSRLARAVRRALGQQRARALSAGTLDAARGRRLVAGSRGLISTGGMSSFLEACALDVPVGLMLPSNLTQHALARDVSAHWRVPLGVLNPTLGSMPALDRSLRNASDEEQAVAAVGARCAEALQDQALLARLQDAFGHQIDELFRTPRPTEAQREDGVWVRAAGSQLPRVVGDLLDRASNRCPSLRSEV